MLRDSGRRIWRTTLVPLGALIAFPTVAAASAPAARLTLCSTRAPAEAARTVALVRAGSSVRLVEGAGEGEEDVTAAWGLGRGLPRVAACALGDVDGDGFVDLFVAQRSGAGAGSTITYRLFRSHDGQALAEDRTWSQRQVPALPPDASLKGLALADADADGDLDLALEWESALGTSQARFVHYLHNDAGRFGQTVTSFEGSLQEQSVLHGGNTDLQAQEPAWSDIGPLASSTDYPGPCSDETTVPGTPVYLSADYHGQNPHAALILLPDVGRFRLGISCVATGFVVVRVGPDSALCQLRGVCTPGSMPSEADIEAVRYIPGQVPFFHLCQQHGFGWYDAIHVQPGAYVAAAKSGSGFWGFVDGHGTMDTYAYTGHNGDFQPVNCSTGGGGGGGGGGGDGCTTRDVCEEQQRPARP